LVVTRALPLVGKRFGFGEHAERGAATLHRELLSFASATPERPWFAYVHAMEPHAPYDPRPADAEAMGLPSGTAYLAPPLHDGILPFQQSPEPTADALATLQAQYDGEIRGLSREFGALLDEMRRRGMLETTIVVLLADHGEELHEHGGWQHGHSLHREVTQVPLIVRLPDLLGAAASSSRGLRVGGVATLLDVAPTLVELAGIQYPAHQLRGGSGISLVPNLLAHDGGTPVPVPERRLLGQVSKHRAVIHSLREGSWQLIVAYEPKLERVMLFDDSSDPNHLHDLAAAESLVAGQLRRDMADSFGVLEKLAWEPRARDIDAETAAKLRALGYVGGN
jgi:arylsulfatase A-like enzyme